MTGPEGNLGDLVIRRLALEWIRDAGNVNAFVGRHSEEWLSAMPFRKEDHLTRGGALARTFWLLRCAVAAGSPVLVTDPGETWVTLRRLPYHLFLLLLSYWLKLRGGSIIIPPHAIAQQKAARISRLTLSLHARFAASASLCLWRESWSHEVTRAGELVPDIAFHLNPVKAQVNQERDFCVVSFRGDRPQPSDHMLDGIQAFADSKQLQPLIVSQVVEDDGYATELGDQRDWPVFCWDPHDSGSEAALLDLYQRARLAISDRLHVLILAAVQGAAPAELVPKPERKIGAHFLAAGFANVSIDSRSLSGDQLIEWLENRAVDQQSVSRTIDQARGLLAQSARGARVIANKASGATLPGDKE
ncbi:polysaccharide pyruvyl transferase family protein [Curtobacterium flaccumfaciens pv. beticola]|uniref:polysaccharide pyruvyl transferase family protein n=1 Tax=Curtobacterium flaccumfaciens TaxID=2035 RepID=UPI00349F7324|nr:polysaccharide pyruvyl transferase family protein [Curtobacterium flaccumfaciens pv. basellae]